VISSTPTDAVAKGWLGGNTKRDLRFWWWKVDGTGSGSWPTAVLNYQCFLVIIMGKSLAGLGYGTRPHFDWVL